ncbi:MAG TPA: methylmalonyl Co-A mutase-associated GTPase MeaB [Steroidobacteraceae bacterium]|jgi:LAO/AO transport system kinase
MSDLARDLLAGNVAAGARAIRWLDDGDPRGRELLREIFPHTGRAHLVGITGPPGAGKSTLVGALISEARSRGRRVGVIAVDPSSPFTGGAILGDRVRMQRHALDEGVFVRSMGTRGQAGGLSRSTFDASVVLDAMGYDLVLVETVGVGQDEIDIVSLAHTTVIVMVPGLGDEVQAIKAGLLEVGDVFVLNKADREGAEQIGRELELMLHLRSQQAAAAHWLPPLLRTVAARGEGCAAVADALEAHAVQLRANGQYARQAGLRSYHQFTQAVREAVRQRLEQALRHTSTAALVAEVHDLKIDPYSAADALLTRTDLGTLCP